MRYCLLIIYCLITICNSNAQNINCVSNHFWANNGDNNILDFTITGSTVTYNNIIVIPGSATYTGVAYGDNLNGGTGPTFYANNAYSPVYYNGSSWVNTNITLPGPVTYQIMNPGGYGNFVYYLSTLDEYFDGKAIYRYNGTSLTKIYETLPNRAIKVADLAVDNAGNCWVVAGDNNHSNFFSDSIYAISPQGEIIHRYYFNHDCYSAYGSFILDDVLYIGFGGSHASHPNTLLPITIIGDDAIVGASMAMPITNLNDLASCTVGAVTSQRSISKNDELLNVFPIPAKEELYIKNSNTSINEYYIYDVNGTLMSSYFSSSETTRIDTRQFPAGMYYIKCESSQGTSSKIFIKE